MSLCKGKEIVRCLAERNSLRKKHDVLETAPSSPLQAFQNFKRKCCKGDKKEKGTIMYLFKRCSFLWTSEIRKAVMNYRHIQGGQERSQTNEHGGDCVLSIASNLKMNNSKISVLRWSKVSKKTSFLKLY